MEIDHQIDLYGIIGRPLSHTLSPAVHNALFKKMGLNGIYLPFETQLLKEAIAGVRGLEIKGVSVTVPFKVEIMDYLDEIHPLAKQIGAVNTIVNKKGRLIGYNTDATGAIGALEQSISLNGKTCLVIGAGGAACAICFSLKHKGCTVTITNRSTQRGEDLAGRLGLEFVPMGELNKIDTNIVIQATSAGMYPRVNECPLDVTGINADVAMDIVYNPVHTEFIRRFKAKHAKTITGVDMFVFQAAEQFKLWTGIAPPIEYMKQIVLKELQTHFAN